MAFVRVANIADVPLGSIRELQVNGKNVAVAHLEGRFFAIDNTCLHRGGPLGQGQLVGRIVTCPWHGWGFDVTTGKSSLSPSVGVACYAIEERGEELFVDLGSTGVKS